MLEKLAMLLLAFVFCLFLMTPAGQLVMKFSIYFLIGYPVLVIIGIACVVRLERKAQNSSRLNLQDLSDEAMAALGFFLFTGFLFLVALHAIHEGRFPFYFAVGSFVFFVAGFAKTLKLRKLASSISNKGTQYTSWQCPDCLRFNDRDLLTCPCGYRSPQAAAYADWQCPDCLQFNDRDLLTCPCGYPPVSL